MATFIDKVPVFPETSESFRAYRKDRTILNLTGNLTFECTLMHLIEFDWCCDGRPFFNLYPSIGKSLAKSNLRMSRADIPASVINQLKTICIKLPLGHKLENLDGVDHIYIDLRPEVPRFLSKKHKSLVDTDFTIAAWGEKSLLLFLSSTGELAGQLGDAKRFVGTREKAATMTSIAIGVMFLASDPNYIVPELLAADRGKEDPDGRLAAKARKRGVHGYSIGQHIEKSPHLRCPHFAIRWTGKGGEIPVLRPVKGSIVHRNKATEVPTGFESD